MRYINPRYLLFTHFYSPKTAENTKSTKEKTEHMQIPTIHGFRCQTTNCYFSHVKNFDVTD